jgi:hypothetical protein
LVMIRSRPCFRLMIPILPSITERFLKSDLNGSCYSAGCLSGADSFLRARPLSQIDKPYRTSCYRKS